jgi:hypothetical protein
VVAAPRDVAWRPARSCRDSVTRLARLCAAVGIEASAQVSLIGAAATRAGVAAAIAHALAALEAGGLFVLTFTGHSDRRNGPPEATTWRLHDSGLGLADLAGCLGPAARESRVVVVVDSCYAAALARMPPVAASLVVLAACGEDQLSIDRRCSDFVVRLERLVVAGGARNPDCVDHRWLAAALARESPDAELPAIWSNDPAALDDPPFTAPTQMPGRSVR